MESNVKKVESLLEELKQKPRRAHFRPDYQLFIATYARANRFTKMMVIKKMLENEKLQLHDKFRDGMVDYLCAKGRKEEAKKFYHHSSTHFKMHQYVFRALVEMYVEVGNAAAVLKLFKSERLFPDENEEQKNKQLAMEKNNKKKSNNNMESNNNNNDNSN